MVPNASDKRTIFPDGVKHVYPSFTNLHKANKFRRKSGGTKENNPIITFDVFEKGE